MKYSIILPYYNRRDYLSATLQSYSHLYENMQNLEVIIVDDGSDSAQRVEDLASKHNLNIRIVRIDTKSGINPCYPYNVGARQATGDILILSSPETIHTNNIFEICNNFLGFSDQSYYLFSVFCPTDMVLNSRLLSNINFTDKLAVINKLHSQMYTGLGAHGRPQFNNEFGSWYLHGKHRRTHLNFLSAVAKTTYASIGGFNEAFRFGTGFDDTDLVERLIPHTPDIQYFDDAVAIHLNHPPVYRGSPVTNESLYLEMRGKYSANDSWGRL